MTAPMSTRATAASRSTVATTASRSTRSMTAPMSTRATAASRSTVATTASRSTRAMSGIDVDPRHRSVQVDQGHGGVEVDGGHEPVEVDVLLDEAGEVEPFHHHGDDRRSPDVEQCLDLLSERLAVHAPTAGQVAHDGGRVVAGRHQRGVPQQPGHRGNNPVHGLDGHDSRTDPGAGDAQGDVEHHPRLGPQVGHRDRTS